MSPLTSTICKDCWWRYRKMWGRKRCRWGCESLISVNLSRVWSAQNFEQFTCGVWGIQSVAYCWPVGTGTLPVFPQVPCRPPKKTPPHQAPVLQIPHPIWYMIFILDFHSRNRSYCFSFLQKRRRKRTKTKKITKKKSHVNFFTHFFNIPPSLQQHHILLPH